MQVGWLAARFVVPVDHVNSNRALAGDTVYGSRKQRRELKRQFLHAHELAFDHPAKGERLEFVCELPVVAGCDGDVALGIHYKGAEGKEISFLRS